MKAKQEQIEKIARIMCGYCSTDGKCAVSENWREPDVCANVDTEHCLYKEYAERLIENGCYGDISEYKAEYKAEVKRLKEVIEVFKNDTECNLNHITVENGQLKAKKQSLERRYRESIHQRI